MISKILALILGMIIGCIILGFFYVLYVYVAGYVKHIKNRNTSINYGLATFITFKSVYNKYYIDLVNDGTCKIKQYDIDNNDIVKYNFMYLETCTVQIRQRRIISVLTTSLNTKVRENWDEYCIKFGTSIMILDPISFLIYIIWFNMKIRKNRKIEKDTKYRKELWKNEIRRY